MVITRNQEWRSEIKALLSNYKDLKVRFSSFRADIVEAISKDSLQAFLVDDSLPIRDLKVVLRSTLLSSGNSDSAVFFAPHDFSTLQDIVDAVEINDLQLINMPTPASEISQLIIDYLFPNNSAQEKVSGTIFSVDPKFMKVVVDAAKSVIEEMGMVKDIAHSAPVFLDSIADSMEVEISGKLSITSHSFKGSFYISFPKSTYLNLYGNIMGEQSEEINDDNKDFASELANITYGKCKVLLNQEGYDLKMAIPSLSLDKIIKSGHPIIVVPYTSSIGEFYIQIAPNLI
ncbi:MAG: chemotaxis protein CheX [Halobacteriovoraceae bacterium]|nr:chemotaxis protein CheX [Halobacteriovoraceae bacterium]